MGIEATGIGPSFGPRPPRHVDGRSILFLARVEAGLHSAGGLTRGLFQPSFAEISSKALSLRGKLTLERDLERELGI